MMVVMMVVMAPGGPHHALDAADNAARHATDHATDHAANRRANRTRGAPTLSRASLAPLDNALSPCGG